MAISAVFKRPFDEQVAFFRGKLGNLIQTERWTDVWKSAHDTGFMVAGAAKADLLADLARAVDQAISEGTGIEVFRKQFSEIVEKHGWSYRGEYNWRTRTIYRTNMATSYSAGRLAQLKEGGFEYWMYRHSDSVARPRPLHVSWDKLALPASDAWWQTHYPPNGWGCQCYVVGVSRKTAERLGGRLTDAPDDGAAPDGTPNGIDRGWDYQPGATTSDQVRRQVLGKIPDLPPAIAADFHKDVAAIGDWDLSTPTGQWHQASYREAPEWLKVGVSGAGQVNIDMRVGRVSYHQGDKIVMGHPQDTPIGKAVWRHEFGHHMDARKANRSFMRSAETDFTQAMDADGAEMKRFSGMGRTSREQDAIAQANRAASKSLSDQAKNLDRTARETWLRGQADEIGVNYDDLRAFFSSHTAPGDLQPGDIERDWWEAQFIQAWKRKDAQGLLDSMEQVVRGDFGQMVSGRGTRAYNKGLAGMVSDLFSAATNKRVEGAGAHSATYYRQRAGWGRQAECWANLCSVAGSGPVGEKLLERFAPQMLEILKGAI